MPKKEIQWQKIYLWLLSFQKLILPHLFIKYQEQRPRDSIRWEKIETLVVPLHGLILCERVSV